MPVEFSTEAVLRTFAAFSLQPSWPWILGLLACLLLLSGADDFLPVLICLCHKVLNQSVKKQANICEADLAEVTERRIAIFVPCWKESGVIDRMVRQNLARIRYHNFEIFLGVYPNDQPTCDAASNVAAGFANVHVVVSPRPGPTSKADCLNAIYNGMVTFERGNGARFDTIVLHDAEDVIHANALSRINRERTRYEMVQIPVLPLPTPASDFTHGIYCDEFSEFQLIDMRARQYSRSFVPSNGVGTGFARDVLENLADQRGDEIFDPSSLTEDYDVGLQIHYAGFRQLFCPLDGAGQRIVATREYFPRKVQSAIRQRTRWITGIALQSWERHGWRGSLRTRYWFWRDRKGLFTNPLTLLTNLIFVAGLTDWFVSLILHRPWAFAVANPRVVKLCLLTTSVQTFRLALRSLCVTRLFGLKMGLTVSFRCFHTNFVNCAASVFALRNYVHSRLQRKTLHWDKTEHAYPVRAAEDQQANLEEVLLKAGYLSREALAMAETQLGPGENLPDFLLANKLVTEADLCRAMSMQSGLPWFEVDVDQVRPEVVRSLPVRVTEDLQVLPFRVSAGRLHIAAMRVPEHSVYEAVSRFTRLQLEFQLVTQVNFAQLRKLLWA